MERPCEGVTGIVLVGGRSSRFGRDKASALLDGELFLSRVVNALAAACREVLVVGAPHQQVPAVSAAGSIRVVRDPTPHEGPLAGLITGLENAGSDWALVCSGDAPMVQPGLLHLLVSKIAGGVDAVVPMVEGRVQPFPSVVRVSCRADLVAQFASGERRIGRALQSLRHVAVAESDVLEADPRLWSFENVNTPADLARLEAALSEA